MKRIFVPLVLVLLSLFSFGFYPNDKAIPDSISNADTGHYIGELYGGGIIVAINPIRRGGGHEALILALKDLPGKYVFGEESKNVVASLRDGKMNTDLILEENPSETSAAAVCRKYRAGGFTDWFLPSSVEWGFLAQNKVLLNEVLAKTSGAQILPTGFADYYYWTSSEFSTSEAYAYLIPNSSALQKPKVNKYLVRPMRKVKI